MPLESLSGFEKWLAPAGRLPLRGLGAPDPPALPKRLSDSMKLSGVMVCEEPAEGLV
jgi:hypothetical protein